MNTQQRDRRLWVVVALASLVLASLVLASLACSPATGPSVELKAAAGQSGGEATELASARLGFVQGNEAIAIENGSRVPLDGTIVAEVFLAPYPPDWQTDLHLFLLDKDDFSPVTDVNVDLVYDMIFMDHGSNALTGTKVKDGHYVLPLAFLMYGDWSVGVTLDLPDGRKNLDFIVKFYPRELE